MMAASRDRVVEEASRVDAERIRALLHESASWWSATAQREPLPLDRVWACFHCTSCGEIFDRTFRCPSGPWTGEQAPLYRSPAELERVVEDTLASRCSAIAPDEWRRAAECACRAPHHHRRVAAAGLFHTMMGAGAGVLHVRVEGEAPEWLRLPEGAGAPSPAPDLLTAFGGSLTLFDAWAELTQRLPASPGTVVGAGAGSGVLVLAASSEADLAAGIRAKLGVVRRIVVRLDASTVLGAAWPRSLDLLARTLEEGAAAAIVVEHDAMLAQARAWARSRLAADVRDDGQSAWTLTTDHGEWPLAPARIALRMAQLGRTLAEACAHELHEAMAAIDDRIATLGALTSLVPGSAFDVHGTTATARLPDGRSGRTLELTDIPANAGALPSEVIAREAAFFFDVAPPWADRTRVCACGAAMAMERRLVPWPWGGPQDEWPWVVHVWRDEAQVRAAEIVALVCGRHVRVPAESELRRAGVDERQLAARLEEAPLGVLQLDVRVRSGVVLARGAFASSIAVSDGRARALDEALGRPIGRPSALAWAIGTDLVVLARPGDEDPDGLVRRLVAEEGLAGPVPFWIRREVALTAAPLGAFDMTVERR